MLTDENAKNVVLVLAPNRSDAVATAKVLQEADVPAAVCSNLVSLAKKFDESINAFLIAEEALVADQLPGLLDALAQQPPWSDIPIIVFTSSGGSERMGRRALEIFGPGANVTLLERPLHTATLVSTVQVAVRARRKQRQVRDLIKQREAILSGISDAFSALDREWRYTFVNDNVAQLAGRPKEEMIGRVIWEVFPDAVGGEFYERCQKAMITQQPDHFEIYYKPWKRWLDTRIYPTESGLVIFRADITPRKQQEAELRKNQQELQELQERSRLAVEAADVGTFDYDPATKEIRWSSRCNELFALPPEAKATYEKYIAAIHPEDRHIVFATSQHVLEPKSRGRYDIEYRVIGIEDAQERWISEKGRAMLDAEGRATRFIGTMLDVTEAKNAAIALQRAKHEAEEANRAKDQFLAMLSHELRTPLTPVLMTINVLQRDPNISHELLRDLEMLQRNVELEALLIDDLLDLTRISHGKLELHNDGVDIHTALEHALTIALADVVAKNLKVTRNFQASEHHSWADAARLQQVFWNLIKNAIKFTTAGGSIELRTHNDEAHHVVIEVADDGAGIAPELQPRIFDAFEQGGRAVTSKYGGLGLGLAISKRVIDLHGGTISVNSPGEGQGTTFTVRLKAMETSLLEGPAQHLPFDARQTSRASILLVEDHQDTANVLRRILERAGYDVSHGASITQAEDLASTHRFDLVISDVGLPDGSGLDLMSRLRKTYGLTGIALSGYGMDEDRAASRRAGFAEHFTKPVDAERLRNAIEHLMAAHLVESR